MSEVKFEGVRFGKPKYDMEKDEFTLQFILGGGWNQCYAAVRELMGVEGTAALTVKGTFQAHIDEEIERQRKAEAEKEQVAVDAPPPEPGTLEAGLWQALHESPAACDKWNECREKGVSDEALVMAIEQEFYLGEAEHRKNGDVPYMVRGGDNPPAFWWESVSRRNRPTLIGEKLLTKVREVLSIPTPEQVAAVPQEREPGEDVAEEAGAEAAGAGF